MGPSMGPFMRSLCEGLLWGLSMEAWMVTASGDLFKSQRAAPGPFLSMKGPQSWGFSDRCSDAQCNFIGGYPVP